MEITREFCILLRVHWLFVFWFRNTLRHFLSSISQGIDSARTFLAGTGAPLYKFCCRCCAPFAPGLFLIVSCVRASRFSFWLVSFARTVVLLATKEFVLCGRRRSVHRMGIDMGFHPRVLFLSSLTAACRRSLHT